MKSEIRISKYETISKSKIQNSKRFEFKKLVLWICFGFSASYFVLFPALAFAQDTNVQYNLIQPLPGIQSVPDFPTFISIFIPFLLGLAGLLSLIQIVRGGIMRAVSGGNPSAIGDANDMIWQAILGLVLALSAYLILNTINPDLVNLKFKPLDIRIQTPASEKNKEDLCKEKKCAATDDCIINNGKVMCIPLPPMGP